MNKITRAFQIGWGVLEIWKETKKDHALGDDFSEAGPRINKVIYRLGPTFIKLGQMLSVRTDIVPVALADQLRQLLDQGLPVAPETAEHLFKEELHKTAAQLFTHFELKPFAVASISQVHRATYHGKIIAVKVQKPGIAELIHQDLMVMHMLIPLLSLAPTLRPMRKLAENTVKEFFGWIEHELDYRLEALNMSRISANFKNVSYFKVPEVIHELSTKRLLCMEFIDGVSLNDVFDTVPNFSAHEIIRDGKFSFHRKTFIEHARNIVFKQVVEDGYFHADPHPGNIMIMNRGVIAYIDFGIVGVLAPGMREALFNILAGLIQQDVEKIATTLITLDQIEGHDPLPKIEQEIRTFINNWQSGSILEKTTAQAFFDLLQIALKSGIDLPVPAIILGKTILEYDGVLRKLDPEFDLLRSFEPLIKSKSGLKGGLENWTKDLVPTSVKEMAKTLETFPTELQGLIKKLADDGVELSVRFGAPHQTQSQVAQAQPVPA